MGRRRKGQLEFLEQGGAFLKSNRKVLAGVVLFLAIVIFAVVQLNNFLHTADFFDCKEIEIIKYSSKEGFEPKRDYFKLSHPVNVFEADPLALSNKIKQAHSEFQNVTVTKFLPNRLIATIVDRRAFAKIKVGKTFLIDNEGVVVSSDTGFENQVLPIITGIESRLSDPSPGKKLDSKRLSKALDILSRVQGRKEFKGSIIEAVDMTYPEKASFKMDGMVVIVGENELDRKLDALALSLQDPAIQKSRVESIDLRFTDIVFKFKPEKK